jgi:hypothetical protein
MKDRICLSARQVPVVAGEPLLGGDRYSYADAFEIRLSEPDERSAEQFTRCAFEQASWPVRRTIAIAFRVIGLRILQRCRLLGGESTGEMLAACELASTARAL